jgi:hypothetical protein
VSGGSVALRPVEGERPDSRAASSRVAPRGELYLLQRSDHTGPPMFSQFDSRYASSPMVVQNGRSQRTIATSGCGLCAVASYLAAAGCREARYDAAERTFTAGDAPLNPRNLNEFLTNWSTARGFVVRGTHHPIYNYDPRGALRDTALATWQAINALVELSQGLAPGTIGTTDQPGFRAEGHELHGVEGRIGRAIPALDAWLGEGKPALLGVTFRHGEAGSLGHHIVLAVGYGRVAGETYYVVLDSGWSNCATPYDAVDVATQRRAFSSRENPVLAGELLRCSVSPGNRAGRRGHEREYVGISHWKGLAGLERFTRLSLQPSPPAEAPPGAGAP